MLLLSALRMRYDVQAMYGIYTVLFICNEVVDTKIVQMESVQ